MDGRVSGPTGTSSSAGTGSQQDSPAGRPPRRPRPIHPASRRHRRRQVPLVGLSGEPGAGKTRLLVELAVRSREPRDAAHCGARPPSSSRRCRSGPWWTPWTITWRPSPTNCPGGSASRRRRCCRAVFPALSANALRRAAAGRRRPGPLRRLPRDTPAAGGGRPHAGPRPHPGRPALGRRGLDRAARPSRPPSTARAGAHRGRLPAGPGLPRLARSHGGRAADLGGPVRRGRGGGVPRAARSTARGAGPCTRPAAGNPFYLEALARMGSEPIAGGGGPDELPPAIRAALRVELSGLPADARLVAQAAAVAADEFEPALAAVAAELPEDRTLEAISELVARDVVRPASPGRFRFRHPLVRHAAYGSAAAGWQLAAHARIAAHLAGWARPPPPRPPRRALGPVRRPRGHRHPRRRDACRRRPGTGDRGALAGRGARTSCPRRRATGSSCCWSWHGCRPSAAGSRRAGTPRGRCCGCCRPPITHGGPRPRGSAR